MQGSDEASLSIDPGVQCQFVKCSSFSRDLTIPYVALSHFAL